MDPIMVDATTATDGQEVVTAEQQRGAALWEALHANPPRSDHLHEDACREAIIEAEAAHRKFFDEITSANSVVAATTAVYQHDIAEAEGSGRQYLASLEGIKRDALAGSYLYWRKACHTKNTSQGLENTMKSLVEELRQLRHECGLASG
eukprot:TRINITY_DN25189_c0_g1_i1.p2 TRINITY_DN25189_c0_g1~~TRINITY_DN25189_c0_g1_i1.p2  ORF type:complete len:149 (+),score=34.40 TRINITY_DN25189_c0_g1_i1:747-1193(+)